MRKLEPITQSLNVSDFKSQVDNLVDAVNRKETRVLVEQRGVPVAALVSADDLERLTGFDREREERRQLLARLRAPFMHLPPEQIEREVAGVIADVRAEVVTEPEPAAAER